MAIFTWGGTGGTWSDHLAWVGFALPGTGDSAVIPPGAGSYTVTLDAPVSLTDLTVTAPNVTLLVESTLALTGTLNLGSATLDLAGSGVIEGGTVDASSGTLVMQGGTVEGVSWVGQMPGGGYVLSGSSAGSWPQPLTITGTIGFAGSVSLDGALVVLDATGTLEPALEAQAGSRVTIGASTQIMLQASDNTVPVPNVPVVAGVPLEIGGAGSWLNLGTIAGQYSADPSNAALGVTIGGETFDNAGTISLSPELSQGSDITTTLDARGRPVTEILSWTFARPLTVHATAQVLRNEGAITLSGGTLAVSGQSFVNSGSVTVTDLTEQQLVNAGGTPVIQPQVLPGKLLISAEVAQFSNTGTILAGTVEFDNSIGLDALSHISGQIVVDGTLDLGGGTLDVTQYPSLSIPGLVRDGTIIAPGTALAGGTLENVTVQGALDVPAVTLRGEDVLGVIALHTLALGDGVVLDAGTLSASGAATLSLSGQATLGPGTTLTVGMGASLAASGTLVESGAVALDGGAMSVTSLDGSGTFELDHGARLTISALSPTAAPIVMFGTDPSALALPGSGVMQVVLNGLKPGDVIDFTGLSSTAVPGQTNVFPGAALNDGTLAVQAAGGDYALVSVAGGGTGLTFEVLPDAKGGTLLTVACFCSGTRILTEFGEVPVESLQVGDILSCVSLTGPAFRPVRWIGRSRVDLDRHPAPQHAAPVRIEAGALGPGMPLRDLFLSPDHAVQVEEALVPVHLLINGATIRQEPARCMVTYWHVELDAHDLILAEGLAAETYLDTGNRDAFESETGPRALHPAFGARAWETCAVLPLLLDGPELAAAHARLLAHALEMGHALTDDPALAAEADGVPVAMERDGPHEWGCAFPQPPGPYACARASSCRTRLIEMQATGEHWVLRWAHWRMTGGG
jgi:hypothetical protein